MYKLVLIFLLLLGCNADHQGNLKIINPKKLKGWPTLVDSLKFENTPLNNSTDTLKSWSHYLIYYIGIAKDTIIASFGNEGYYSPTTKVWDKNFINFEGTIYLKSPLIQYNFKRHSLIKERFNLTVEIDTLNSINNLYPVLISNKHSDTLFFKLGSYLDIVMEAKDSIGNWKSIEQANFYSCGIGLPNIILPPQNYILTFAPIYKGNYKTEMRLRFGDNYSKTWFGRINYGQFKSNNYY